MKNNFDDFIKVFKKDLQVCDKINEVLGRYNRYAESYQAKIGYKALILNVILKEILNLIATTTTNLDKDLKMKISRIEYLESKTNSQILKRAGNLLYSKFCDVDSWNFLIN